MSAALVTGGAKRIGAAIVRGLADAGYAVAIHCNRSRDEAETLAGEIQRAGAKATVLCCDLADHQSLGQLTTDAAVALGPITLLVNNAAIFSNDAVDTMAAESFAAHMDVNLRAPLLLSQAFARQAGAGASIVNIIDQRVLKPTPQYLSYALSKEALWSATRMLAQALAPRIRVNAVAPGPCLPNETDGDPGFLRETAAIPLARAVDPAEIAEAVLYLARAASITGQLIAVDGGQHLGWRTPDVVAVAQD